MRKTDIAIICTVVWIGVLFYAFSLGKAKGHDDYFLLNTPSYISVLLDLRDNIVNIPEQVRVDNNIKVEDFDYLLRVLSMAHIAREEEFASTYKRMGKADESCAKLKKQIARAVETSGGVATERLPGPNHRKQK